MNLVKTGLYTSFSTAVRILASLIIVKVIAIYVGPQGLGKMGQFMSLMTIMSVLAGGGISNGIIKYIAEYRQNDTLLTQLIRNGTFFTLASSLIIGILGTVFSKRLAMALLGSTNYNGIILTLALGQFFIALNNFWVAIVNGFKDVSRLTYLNISGTIAGLIILVLLIKYYQLYGGLLGLVLMQSILAFVTIFYIRKATWFKINYFKFSLNKDILAGLSKFSLMSITTTIVTPIAQIIIRNHVQGIFSWTDVGYWQAVTKISDVYLLFITTALTVYYLPRLSEIQNPSELKKEILSAYKIILPAVTAAAFLIYLCKSLIIQILFTSAFLPMKNLFLFQLIGDVIKISAWLLSFLILAKTMTKIFITTEVIFNISFVLLSYFLLGRFGLTGLTLAFAINNLFYLFTMTQVFRWYFKKLNSNEILQSS